MNNFIVYVDFKNEDDVKNLADDNFFKLENIIESAKESHKTSTNKELFEIINLNENITCTIIEGDISPAIKNFLNEKKPGFLESVYIYREEEKWTE